MTPIVIYILLGRGALLITYMLGIVVCARKRNLAPRASRLAIIAIGLLLFSQLGMMALQWLIVHFFPQFTTIDFHVLLGVVSSLLTAGGTILLIAAVFAGRPDWAAGSGFEVRSVLPIGNDEAAEESPVAAAPASSKKLPTGPSNG